MTSVILAAESGLTLGQYECSVGAIDTGGKPSVCRLCVFEFGKLLTPTPPTPPAPLVPPATLLAILPPFTLLPGALLALPPKIAPAPVTLPLAVKAAIGGRLSVRSACFCICFVRYVSCVYDLPQYWQMCVFRCLDSLCLGI